MKGTQKEINKIRKNFTVPVGLFSNRTYGVLEILVHEMRKKGLRNCDIARILNRDDRTIYTVIHRYDEKTLDK